MENIFTCQSVRAPFPCPPTTVREHWQPVHKTQLIQVILKNGTYSNLFSICKEPQSNVDNGNNNNSNGLLRFKKITQRPKIIPKKIPVESRKVSFKIPLDQVHKTRPLPLPLNVLSPWWECLHKNPLPF